MTAKQILIVEDERPIREMIAFGLKRAGFEVREAEDSRAARSAIADRRPDLMLIDWMLPDTSGLELTRALKRDRVSSSPLVSGSIQSTSMRSGRRSAIAERAARLSSASRTSKPARLSPKAIISRIGRSSSAMRICFAVINSKQRSGASR